jgi:hypothetical protein
MAAPSAAMAAPAGTMFGAGGMTLILAVVMVVLAVVFVIGMMTVRGMFVVARGTVAFSILVFFLLLAHAEHALEESDQPLGFRFFFF